MNVRNPDITGPCRPPSRPAQDTRLPRTFQEHANLPCFNRRGRKAFVTTGCNFSVDQIISMSKGDLHGYIFLEMLYNDVLDDTSLHKTQFSEELINVTYTPPPADKP